MLLSLRPMYEIASSAGACYNSQQHFTFMTFYLSVEKNNLFSLIPLVTQTHSKTLDNYSTGTTGRTNEYYYGAFMCERFHNENGKTIRESHVRYLHSASCSNEVHGIFCILLTRLVPWTK